MGLVKKYNVEPLLLGGIPEQHSGVIPQALASLFRPVPLRLEVQLVSKDMMVLSSIGFKNHADVLKRSSKLPLEKYYRLFLCSVDVLKRGVSLTVS